MVVYLGTPAGDCGRMRFAFFRQSATGPALLRQAWTAELDTDRA